MKFLSRCLLVAGCMAFALLTIPVAHAQLTPSEQAAVFKAAGFKRARGEFIRCKEETPTASRMPGRIEVTDLNGDGQPEAWVKESSVFCYGQTAEYFALVTKDSGRWRLLLNDVGVPVVLKAKYHGWPDIKVGGPGFGRKFPVYRWNGKSYVLSK